MKIYKKEYTRENSLIAVEIWEEEQCRLIEKKLGANVPLSVFDVSGGVISTWYHENIFDYWFKLISDKITADPKFVSETMQWFGEKLDQLEIIWHEKKKLGNVEELEEFFYLAAWSWVGLSISYCLPMMQNVPEEDQKLGMALRQRSVEFLDQIDHVIQATLRDMYPGLGDLIKYVSFDEVKKDAIPSLEILKKRQRHYVFFDFKLYVDTDVQELMRRNGIVLQEEDVPDTIRELGGQIAMKGVVQGRVRVLRNKSQIPEIQAGEILVTAMTTPDCLPAMKVAAAFITDEGGITCHAAIVARELKKPCIIGTKIATQVLHDGDLVEVDADNGVVRIIEKRDIV